MIRLSMERKARNLERRRRVEAFQSSELAARVDEKARRMVGIQESRAALLKERQLNEKALRAQRDNLLTNFTRMATSTKFKSLAQTSDATKKDQTFRQLSRQLASTVSWLRPSTVSGGMRHSSSTGSLRGSMRPASAATSASPDSFSSNGNDASARVESSPSSAQQMLLAALQHPNGSPPHKMGDRRRRNSNV